MMRVLVPLRLLKPGDKIVEQAGGMQTLTLTKIVLDGSEPLPDGSSANGWAWISFKEVYMQDGQPHGSWRCCLPSAEFEVIASSGTEVGARVAEALDAFDSQVRAYVARTFCSTCGERECKRHR